MSQSADLIYEGLSFASSSAPDVKYHGSSKFINVLLFVKYVQLYPPFSLTISFVIFPEPAATSIDFSAHLGRYLRSDFTCSLFNSTLFSSKIFLFILSVPSSKTSIGVPFDPQNSLQSALEINLVNWSIFQSGFGTFILLSCANALLTQIPPGIV